MWGGAARWYPVAGRPRAGQSLRHGAACTKAFCSCFVVDTYPAHIPLCSARLRGSQQCMPSAARHLVAHVSKHPQEQ